MRRIVPFSVVGAVALAAGPALVGCDAAAEPATSPGTIAVGSLPAALPTAPTAPTTPAPTTVPSPSTEPDSSPPPPTPSPTRFVVELDGLVEGDIPPRVDVTTVRDDTGRLRVSVPRDWSEHRTTPARLGDGTETASVAASPALTSFLDGYDVPGLTALVVPDDPAAALQAYTFAEDCLRGRSGEYRAAAAAGRYAVWESCGGTINDIVTIAVRPVGAAESVLLLVQIVDPVDLAALDAAVGSLSLGP